MSVAKISGPIAANDGQSKWLSGILLALIMLAALWIRVAYQVDYVFADGEIRFQETDPWCHMRQVDALVRTFPRQNFFDVYGAYPGGSGVAVAPFYDWILALIILIVGLGNPSQAVIDHVGAFFPAVLGAIVPLVAYHFGRLLFNRAGGFAAAVLTAFAPGQLLVRSLLGYTDHHAMESLLSTVLMLCLVSFLLRAEVSRRASVAPPGEISRQEAAGRSKWTGLPIAVASALALALYLLSWTGGAIVVGILAAWLCCQLVVNRLLGRETRRLVLLGLVLFSIPLVLVMPYSGKIFGFSLQVLGLSLGLAAVSSLGLLAWGSAKLRLRGRWFLVAVLAAGGLGVLAFRIVAPQTFASIIWQFTYFSGGHSTIQEAQPLLAGGTSRLWSEFGPPLYIAIVGLTLIAVRVVRRGEAPALLVLVWSIAMAAATFSQIRFSYYLGVVVAILAGGVVGLVFARMWNYASAPRSLGDRRGGERTRRSELRSGGGVRRRPATSASGGRHRGRLVFISCLCLAISIAVMWPTTRLALASARSMMVPNADWVEAMQWLRHHTPEPFGDSDAYYAYYGSPDDCRSLLEAETAYGVLGWWDCGYWITRIAHRPPISNPTQHAAGTVARFMTAQDEETASQIARKCGARYVVLDVELPAWQPTDSNVMMGKFESLVRWTDRNPSEFYEHCFRRDAGGALRQVVLYYPEYYRTLISRLYVCRGRAYDPKEVFVAACRPAIGDNGEAIKEIVSLQKFDSHAQAEAFIAADASLPYRIVGISPFYPCVPLEAMHDYTLVHQSKTVQGRRSGDEVRYVEIYEFSGTPAVAPGG